VDSPVGAICLGAWLSMLGAWHVSTAGCYRLGAQSHFQATLTEVYLRLLAALVSVMDDNAQFRLLHHRLHRCEKKGQRSLSR
jgi:hypothetical protein